MMPGTHNKSWDGEEACGPGAFGHLLERMNNHFTPNPVSSHFQPGFVPANTPPWEDHAQQILPLPLHASLNQQSLHNSHVRGHLHESPADTIGMDCSSALAAQVAQVGVHPSRSYSVSQEPFPNMNDSRPNLLRSSSDLGVRLCQSAPYNENYQDWQQGSAAMGHKLEPSVEGQMLFNQSLHISQPNPNLPGTIFERTSTSSPLCHDKHQPHYGLYRTEESSSIDGSAANNFSTKLSNFTASLGTWFSPVGQFNDNNYLPPCSNQQEVAVSKGALHSKGSSYIQKLSDVAPDHAPTLSNSYLNSSIKTNLTPSAKPSYSDVLSKVPSNDSVNKSINGLHVQTSKSSAGFHSGNNSQKYRDGGTRGSHSKSRNRTAAAARSNSPNTSFNTGNLNSSYGNHKQNFSKFESSSYSKVGLDDFDIPENVSYYNINNSYSNYMSNYSNSKSLNFDNLDKSRKKSTPEELSPNHHSKKSSRKSLNNSVESVEPPDIDKGSCNQLNNHTPCSQQKQTPKRTSYINNNLGVTQAGSKFNNSEIGTSAETPSKKNSPERDKFFHDSDDGNSSATSPEIFSSNFELPCSKTSDVLQAGVRVANVKATKVRSSGSGKSSSSQGKKSHKKKKETFGIGHSDLFVSGCSLFLLWLGLAAKAGLWLLVLVTDVAQMSGLLLMHFGNQMGTQARLCISHWSSIVIHKWKSLLGRFSKKKSEKKLGWSERKCSNGLETNLPLPTTGDEAMKRILDCRGKDPYGILGVASTCSDDDIKRYYKRQAFLVHPDKNKQPGAEEAFKILAHAFEIIGEPERRGQYDSKLVEEANLDSAWGELSSLLTRLREKLEEAANTIRCTNCSRRHKRIRMPNRPVYAARQCADCNIRHAAREGDIWAESWLLGLRWCYFACMEGAIYNISEWAACQKENLKHLQANTHSVQYRIVSGKKNPPGKNAQSECPTDPELEEFFNNLCRERFGQDFVPGSGQGNANFPSSDTSRKRKGKKKK